MSLLRQHFNKLLAVACLLVLALLGMLLWRAWQEHEWFQVQREQMAAIQELADDPPPGWTELAWQTEITTLTSVWGNITYHPDDSRMSIQEMWGLSWQLDAALDLLFRGNGPRVESTSQQKVESIYDLMLSNSPRTEFIAGYRDEFRQQCQARQADHAGEAGVSIKE